MKLVLRFLGGFFRGRAGTGNVDHAQQTEDESLDKAGEKVEIDGKNSGNTKLEDGNIFQNAGKLQDTGYTDNGKDNAKDPSAGLAGFTAAPRTRTTMGTMMVPETRPMIPAESMPSAVYRMLVITPPPATLPK